MSTRKKSLLDAPVLAVLGNDEAASGPRDATTATILQGLRLGPPSVLEGETGLRRTVLKAIEATGVGNFPQLTRQKTALYRYKNGKSYRSAWAADGDAATLSVRLRVHSDVATYNWRKRKRSRLQLVDAGTAASNGCRELFTLSVDLDAKASVLEAFYMGLDRSCRHALAPDAAMRIVHDLNMDLGLESCSVYDCSFGRHGTPRSRCCAATATTPLAASCRAGGAPQTSVRSGPSWSPGGR
jgi:hypothetical protein